MPRKEQDGGHGWTPSRPTSMSEQQPAQMSSILIAMSVTPVSALYRTSTWPLSADIVCDREPPEHVSSCKCNQFGTWASLNGRSALHGPGRRDALALAASRGSKHGRSDENPMQCTLSLFVRLCWQIQNHPFHSHPDHEGFVSAAAVQAASQSRSDHLGALAFVIAGRLI